jgi:ATP-dependent exoDNAse (exonuclease V) alpha subunit
MATYHLRFGLVQRAKGQSAVAVAADRARVRLHDRRLDRMQAPLPAKRGTMPILSKVLLPDGAPTRWHNREVLWNEVEACGRRRDACLAREVEFALPAELLPYQAAALARDYVSVAFVAEGMAADLNVHWALRPDGQPKPCAQVLLTMRHIGAEGFGLKERAWNDRAAALRWRQLWSLMANICLTAHGHPARIDHRSYAERRIALEPQNKVGPNAARRAAPGEPSERVDENRAIARRNAERSAGRTVGKQSR